jgi:hypothetical protein
MRPQLLIAGAVLVASVSGAVADTYACRSLNDPDFPVTANFELTYIDDVFAVPSADLQIEGDMGYSTTAEHPSNRAFVTDLEVGNEAIKFNFHLNDGQYDVDVARLHVVTLSEGVYSHTGGVLQVGGGGLWTIQCDVVYDQPYDH